MTVAQAALALPVLERLSHGRRRRAPLGPGAPEPGGTVSVVVPARDEEDRLGPCLAGLVDDPDLLEVLVVDDRSSDGTAALARAAGATVLEGEEPPPGWAGKAWALEQGIRAARGDWVVHVDADVRPRPGLARALVAAATEHGDDLLSATVPFRCATAPDLVLHPSFTATIPYRAGPVDAEGWRPPAGRAILNGQVVLLPRERFQRAGGYGRVRGHQVEDVALARELVRDGWRIGFVDARALAEVEMYPSARGTWTGWSRSIAGRDVTPPGQLAVDVAALWLLCALPVLRLLARRTTRVDRALLAVRFGLAAAVGAGYRPRSPLVLLAPLADPAVAARFTWAVLRPDRRWRGRTLAAPRR
ncbi:glycosyltransferase family 2 protein [Conexibacter sp. SYSU D00693]|uniref:glycosyltransferase n=1 Tax=Conexibacter sp. SYSU D00693 TaxID=2812560 RepID=UPI00196AD2C4|nr:glycosyltransferase [Conexibacter sp. SYSU D00693]